MTSAPLPQVRLGLNATSPRRADQRLPCPAAHQQGDRGHTTLTNTLQRTGVLCSMQTTAVSAVRTPRPHGQHPQRCGRQMARTLALQQVEPHRASGRVGGGGWPLQRGAESKKARRVPWPEKASNGHSAPRGFPAGSAGIESACNAGDPGSIPGLG